MNRLKQLVERDQWAELLTDTQNIYKQSAHSKIEVLAFSEKEALNKASAIFNVPDQYLEFEKISNNSVSFLGLVKKPGHYIFSVKRMLQNQMNTDIHYDQHNELANHKDGSFRLQMRKQGLKLQVFDPKGLGKPVSISEITDALHERGIIHPDMKIIHQAIQYPNKTVIIAPYHESDNNSTFDIDVAKDGMTASLTFTKPTGNGRLPEVDEVIKRLLQHKVQYGINEEYISEALDNELYNIPIIVAEGKPAIHGSDADIEYHFPTGSEAMKHAVRADGSIDFKELNIIHNVYKDDILATIHPATEGEEGRTVLNEVIHPNHGTAKTWDLGSNVYLSDDKSYIKATTSGQVYLKNNQICVDPVLEIKSDVDLSTGNIDFLGNIVIKGNITDGFSVVSGGNIEIHGHIGKCFIHSDGNIIARQGIQGKDATQIECRGDFFARFVERATLNVGGNLIITKSLLHSHVISDNGVYVIGDKKSIIAGGSIKAKTEIVSTQIGAESYIDTQIEVGFCRILMSEIKTFNKVLVTLEQQKREQQQLLEQKVASDEALKIQKHIEVLIMQKQKTEQSLSDKKRELEQIQNEGLISVSNCVMPGVKIKIGKILLDVTMKQNSANIIRDNNQIIFGKYIPSSFTNSIAEKSQSSKSL